MALNIEKSKNPVVVFRLTTSVVGLELSSDTSSDTFISCTASSKGTAKNNKLYRRTTVHEIHGH